MNAPTPSEAVRVAVQECKRLVRHLSMEAHSSAETAALDIDAAALCIVEGIDALAALSLHVGDAADALGATPAGSGSTLQQPSAASAAIPGANASRMEPAEPVTFVDGTPTAWISECPFCRHTLHFEPKAGADGRVDRKDALLLELAETWELQAETGGDGLNKFAPAARETLRMCADALRMLADFSQRAKPHEPSVAAYWQKRALEAEAALAQAIVTREGQDPQGLGGEAIERGPEGMRPEEIAQPSLHIEPAPGHRWIQATMEEWDEVQRIRDAATTPTEGPAQTLTVDELRGLDTPTRVRFYEHDFYVLSNFSSFSLLWGGIRFPTSEHVYHYMKFAMEEWREDPNDPTEGRYEQRRILIARAIHGAPSAHEAFKIAELHREHRRGDWDSIKVSVMRDILRAKAMQHEYVMRKLLATGDRELVEDSWRDDFWGWGPNRDGKNMLGRLWMDVRAELRARTLTDTAGESDA